jgi:hypothetical protein
MSISKETATALRKPFPPESIGKLPKPYKSDSPKGQCNECGGWHGLPAVHLDYVGHAATTDRLLTVDPEWTWEPMGVDQFGLPAPDAQGNLWIKLTVCGVTRIGVGDGKSAKERIGDAIRNAAMRFGVALDLWAKEDLVEFERSVQDHRTPEPSAPPAPVATTPDAVDPAPPVGGAEPAMTARTRGAMFATFAEKGVTEEEQLPRINRLLGTEYTSRGDLTEAHAKAVIAAVKKLPNVAKEAS